MEYVFLSMLAVLLVVLILFFRGRMAGARRQTAMLPEDLADRRQARMHRQAERDDSEPQRTRNRDVPELVHNYVLGQTGDPGRARGEAAWAEDLLRRGGSVWIGDRGIEYQNTPRSHGTKQYGKES